MLRHHNDEAERNRSVKRILAEAVVGMVYSQNKRVYHDTPTTIDHNQKTKKSMVDTHKHRKWSIPK